MTTSPHPNTNPFIKQALDSLRNSKKLNTPSLIFSLESLRHNYKFLTDAIAGGECKLFFAVKANNDPQVVKTLASLGSSFEVASINELKTLLNADVDTSEVIFSNPVKIDSDIKTAYDYGVRHFAFDSASELEKLARLAPASYVYLRIAVSNKHAEWKLEDKFGAELEDSLSLLLQAKQLKLKPQGVTFHVGWNNMSAVTWLGAVKEAEQVMLIARESGINLKVLNLGGGWPTDCPDQESALLAITEKINPYLMKLKKQYGIDIYAEPGSYLTANCGALITQIYARIERSKKPWIFVDASMYQGFHWILAGREYDISTLSTSTSSKLKEFVVTGPTCDSHDVFSHSALLPEDINKGSCLVIYPAGAYTNSTRDYNGIKYPPVVVFDPLGM
jgi:ornithine decarboxylase